MSPSKGSLWGSWMMAAVAHGSLLEMQDLGPCPRPELKPALYRDLQGLHGTLESERHSDVQSQLVYAVSSVEVSWESLQSGFGVTEMDTWFVLFL